jgi:SAM-dependent methyltransferase
MPENDAFWELYWEMHLRPMKNLGKREAILAGSQLMRQLAPKLQRPLRLLELGCGEGQILGTLVNAHAQLCDGRNCTGIDYNAQSLVTCRHDYPAQRWIEGDFTDSALLTALGTFDIIFLVNALHHVFSDCYSSDLGETDVPLGKQRVAQALGSTADRLEAGGWIVLFDGLEMPGDPQKPVQIRFRDEDIRQDFEKFARQYRPFHITYTNTQDPLGVSLSQRDFTRYITKSIFLRKQLWVNERFESYQYYTEKEFQAAFSQHGLKIKEQRTLTVNAEKWHRLINIVTPGVKFPEEHILILAQKEG